MNEEGGIPIIPLLAGAVILAYFALEMNRHRHKLRSIFNVVDRQESAIAATLERMVESGELRPFVGPEAG
jgi:hypothetical protein